MRNKEKTPSACLWSSAGACSLALVFFCTLAGATSARAQTNDLIISEIMYHPLGDGVTDGVAFEFIELKNTGASTLDLAGMAFTNGIDYTFSTGATLAAGGWVVLASNSTLFEARYGVAPFDQYTGRLDNAGERVTLSTSSGVVLFSVRYNDKYPWPISPDGNGFSLVTANPNANADPDNAVHWRFSKEIGGSPGDDDPQAANLPSIYINEVLTHTDFPLKDAIELYNPSANPVDVSGWLLTDDRSTPDKFTLPANTVISAGGHLVLDEDDYNANPGGPSSFALSALGEEVYVFSADEAGTLTGYAHGFSFEASANGVSFGRYLTSTDRERFPAQLETSLGSPNAGPLVGPVVIHELMYHPVDGADEFIELVNVTDAVVPLYDPNHPANTWGLAGVGYTFPQGIDLASGEVVLVVPIAPETFRSKYSLSAQIQIVGPYEGMLDNAGEAIRLQKPDPPTDDGSVPYVVVDAVSYGDNDPWPSLADGGGRSLERIDADAYGDDPVNWAASVQTGGSPGAGLPVYVATPPSTLPETYVLAPVYPNPFHAEATLRFSVNTSQQVYLALYDMLGREVQRLFEGTPPPGTLQTVRIDGTTLPSGIYQVRLKGQGFITSRQMVLIK